MMLHYCLLLYKMHMKANLYMMMLYTTSVFLAAETHTAKPRVQCLPPTFHTRAATTSQLLSQEKELTTILRT